MIEAEQSSAVELGVSVVAKTWFQSHTNKPLLLTKTADGGCTAYQGYVKNSYSQAEAATVLGMSRQTFAHRYGTKKKPGDILRPGKDGKYPAAAVLAEQKKIVTGRRYA